MSNLLFKKGDEAFGVFRMNEKPFVDVCEVINYYERDRLYHVMVVYNNTLYESKLPPDRIFRTAEEANKYNMLLLLGGKQ